LNVRLFIKKYFNWQYIEIHPSLNLVDDKYVLTVHASAPYQKQVDIEKNISSTRNLADELTESLTYILAPEIFAYEKGAKDRSDLDFELHIAKNILADRNKTALILAMQMDSLEKSRTSADLLRDIAQGFYISKEIQDNYDLSFFGNMQYAMKLNLIASQARLNSKLIKLLARHFNDSSNEKNIKLSYESNKKDIEKLKSDAQLIYESSPKTYL